MAQQDPRPLNPIGMRDRQIYVYDAATRSVSAEPLKELLKYLPGKVAQCRIFATSHEHDTALAPALEVALSEERPAHPTNLSESMDMNEAKNGWRRRWWSRSSGARGTTSCRCRRGGGAAGWGGRISRPTSW